jgi:serine/threonine protein kinase
MARIKIKPRRRSSGNPIFVPIGRFLSRADCVKGLKVKRVLGEGTFGAVVAVCRGRKCKYVLKVQRINPPKRRSSIVLTPRSFEDEVAVSKKAGELGISPRVCDSWVCDEHGYILMKRVFGKTLFDVLKNAPTLHKTQQLKARALVKLKKAHDNGLLHRDIHSLNIMVKEHTGEVMFLDWGLLPERTYTKREDVSMLHEAFLRPLLLGVA